MYMKKLLPLVLVAAFAGCTTTPGQCDPSVELSVFNKMACSFSGSYDKRIDAKEQSLATEQHKSQELTKIQEMIAAQQAGVNRSKAHKQKQLAQLNKQVNAYTSQLKQKAQGRQDVMQQINAVEQQMTAVNNSDGSEAEKQKELKKLQDRLAKLQQVIDL